VGFGKLLEGSWGRGRGAKKVLNPCMVFLPFPQVNLSSSSMSDINPSRYLPRIEDLEKIDSIEEKISNSSKAVHKVISFFVKRGYQATLDHIMFLVSTVNEYLATFEGKPPTWEALCLNGSIGIIKVSTTTFRNYRNIFKYPHLQKMARDGELDKEILQEFVRTKGHINGGKRVAAKLTEEGEKPKKKTKKTIDDYKKELETKNLEIGAMREQLDKSEKDSHIYSSVIKHLIEKVPDVADILPQIQAEMGLEEIFL
jgi:hypothetical protein